MLLFNDLLFIDGTLFDTCLQLFDKMLLVADVKLALVFERESEVDMKIGVETGGFSPCNQYVVILPFPCKKKNQTIEQIKIRDAKNKILFSLFHPIFV